MPSPPSATDPANLTIRKPNRNNIDNRPNKRLKLEDSPSPNSGLRQLTQTQISKGKPEELSETDKEDDKEDEDHQCSICLQPLVDRTVIPTCAHEFCFECILVWTGVVQIVIYSLGLLAYHMNRAISQMPPLFSENPRIPDTSHSLQVRLPEALSRTPPGPARVTCSPYTNLQQHWSGLTSQRGSRTHMGTAR